MNSNPYAPPKAAVADIETLEESPPLWNPNAACLWSLFLSPAFGAFLQMKNWQALGEKDKAAVSRFWVIAVAVLMLVMPVIGVLVPGLLGRGGNLWGIVPLIAWYGGSGRQQVAYVKHRFGKQYPRRGWGKPLGYAVLVLVGYVVVAGVIGAIVGTIGGAIGR
jgi:hypothetical protein